MSWLSACGDYHDENAVIDLDRQKLDVALKKLNKTGAQGDSPDNKRGADKTNEQSTQASPEEEGWQTVQPKKNTDGGRTPKAGQRNKAKELGRKDNGTTGPKEISNRIDNQIVHGRPQTLEEPMCIELPASEKENQ